MATFMHGTEINLALEDLINGAEEFLWFISPYIKLHDRIKANLKRRREDHAIQIVIVFGKNESNLQKSISAADMEFLKEFPNVLICYEKNLHAKYYASEQFSIITSMNLHEFSQNTNIEVAMVITPKNGVSKLANIVISASDAGEDAMNYFDDMINQSETLFKKNPIYKSGLFGITKTYTHSEIEIDNLNEFFKGNILDAKDSRTEPFTQQSNRQKYNSISQPGYCIRTGEPISFNPAKPFSYDAFQTWAQFENMDYPEKFCHLTGTPSNGRTSMRNPILQ